MSARGEYRAVFSVLVDTPDFQALHKDARLLWFTIKMSLAASGIGVLYDDQLIERSGLSHHELDPAREALVNGAWLVLQGRVHWLRNGLRYEPHMSLSNANHRRFVANELLGLPKLEIVNQFARYYGFSEPFPNAPDDGMRMVSPCYRDTLGKDGMGDGMGDGIPDHSLSLSPPRIPEESRSTTEIADVENSLNGHEPAPPAEPPRYTIGELLAEAKQVCGMGTWSRDEESRAHSVLRAWLKQGISPERIIAAIHGSRALVDSGKLGWKSTPPRKPFGLRALNNTHTLADQGDGKARRPFFDVAAETYYRALDSPAPRGKRGGVKAVSGMLSRVGTTR